MNTFELSGCCFAFAGATLGSLAGLRYGGPLGALGGAAVGLVGGFIAGWTFVEASFAFGILADRRKRRAALRPHFGRYYVSDKSAEWGKLTASIRIGDSVTGLVVAKFYWGVALDIGGFPGLLAKLRFAEPFSENPEQGTQVTARIDEIDDRNHEFGLTQGRTHAEIVADRKQRARNGELGPREVGERHSVE